MLSFILSFCFNHTDLAKLYYFDELLVPKGEHCRDKAGKRHSLSGIVV
jgi:hypothetical protein